MYLFFLLAFDYSSSLSFFLACLFVFLSCFGCLCCQFLYIFPTNVCFFFFLFLSLLRWPVWVFSPSVSICSNFTALLSNQCRSTFFLFLSLFVCVLVYSPSVSLLVSISQLNERFYILLFRLHSSFFSFYFHSAFYFFCQQACYFYLLFCIYSFVFYWYLWLI